MTYASFIHQITQDGSRWRIEIAEVTDTMILARDMFPYGEPYGVTFQEEMTIDGSPPVGSFFINGLTPDSVQHMDADYAEQFRQAGLVPAPSNLSMEGGPQQGTVRTWFAGVDEPVDMSVEEALELHVDNFKGVQLPEGITVWDPIDNLTVTFEYANGSTYPLVLNSIAQSQVPAAKLLNHSNFLIIPADESLTPVINARTCIRMFELRLALVEADAEYKRQQLEIGFIVDAFRKIIAQYSAADWKNPVGVLQDMVHE